MEDLLYCIVESVVIAAAAWFFVVVAFLFYKEITAAPDKTHPHSPRTRDTRRSCRTG